LHDDVAISRFVRHNAGVCRSTQLFVSQGAIMNAIVDFPILTTLNAYTQLTLSFDVERATLFSWMKPAPRPCFNPKLLDEIKRAEQLIELHQGYFNHDGIPRRVDYMVFGSSTPGVFNLGGDLGMFMHAIANRDRELLTHYAHVCIENQYRRASGFGSNITTIALLEGKALGGGFEAALASDIIVAERSVTMAFPEILFNLFPGMGALTFLSRRIGMKKAEEIIVSGQVFTAKEMHELGIVDEFVEDGMGLEATKRLIQVRRRRQNAHRAVQRARQIVQPLHLSELMQVADVWVDAALQLDARDLRMMARLVKAQDKLMALNVDETPAEDFYAGPMRVSNNSRD
jgi:DSF synthase